MRLFRRRPDPFSPTRYDGIVKGGRIKEHHYPKRPWQWALLGFVLLLLGGVGFATYLYFELQGRIRVDVPVTKEEEGKPINVLLVGSDSRAGLSLAEQDDLRAHEVSGERADTIILAHIDPATDHITMVQFPRDLWVPIAGRGIDKINSALIDGRSALVRTVENITELKINKYAQVNIAGFRDLVDAIGGVDLCVPDPIPFDEQTGFEVTEEEVGMVHFTGERAIRFVRTRSFMTGDFERIANQQRFLSAALNKILSAGTILNPTRITKLARIAGDNVRVDQTTTPLGLLELGRKFRSFDPDRYEAYTVPNLGIGAKEGLSVVLPDWPAVKALFRAMKDNTSPVDAPGVTSVDPSTIRVGIYNGTTIDGRGQAVAEKLAVATEGENGSLQIVAVEDARPKTFKETVIRYEPPAEQLAEAVAAAIPNATLEEGVTKRGVDVAVIVGSRPVKTRRLVQILPIPIPRPSALPAACRQDA
jgi:LCP family protein required for cell wall assembly